MKVKVNEKLLSLQKALNACKKALYYSLLFSFISNLMMLAIPIYSLQVLDRVISSASLETLLMLTLVAFLALTCLSLIQAVRSFIMIKLGGWLDKKLSPVLFAHGIANSAYKRSISAGQHLQDLASIKNFITGQAMSSLLDAPWSLIFIAFLFFIHPAIGLISILGGVVLFVIAILNEISTKPSIESAGEHSIKSSSYADTAARNAEAIEAMGMLENVTKIWQESNTKSSILQEHASRKSAIYSSITRFIRLAVQVAVTGTGAYYVLQTQMSVGAMIAAGILVGRALAPFETAIGSWKGFISARKSLKRLSESLDKSPVRNSSIELPEPKGDISVENVYFAPMGIKKPTISAVNFKLNAGEVLAIIGPSAAGKSTIAKLLTGVWQPGSGNVRLDGADVYSWRRDNFGKYVGYLPQDVELFAGTVKENISRMDSDANDADVVAAAKLANVHELILRLPNDYETQIGNDGMTLSAGQRQRIGLARAYYGNPKLVVLDEPNSSLDNEGDNALLKAIQAGKSQKVTTVIVSHRPAVLQVVDKVLLMSEGKVADFGDRDTVINNMREKGVLPKLKAVKS
jgi:PrtD family type I secretion system ABC transporter